MTKENAKRYTIKALQMNPRNSNICLRLNSGEYNRAKLNANLYAEGNLSKWIRACLMFFEPKMEHLTELKEKIE